MSKCDWDGPNYCGCHDEIAALKSQLAAAQKDRDRLIGYLREIAVYGNKHMPAPEYAQKALAAMEADNGRA